MMGSLKIVIILVACKLQVLFYACLEVNKGFFPIVCYILTFIIRPSGSATGSVAIIYNDRYYTNCNLLTKQPFTDD